MKGTKKKGEHKNWREKFEETKKKMKELEIKDDKEMGKWRKMDFQVA